MELDPRPLTCYLVGYSALLIDTFFPFLPQIHHTACSNQQDVRRHIVGYFKLPRGCRLLYIRRPSAGDKAVKGNAYKTAGIAKQNKINIMGSIEMSCENSLLS